MNGHRQSALLLHALDQSDREWILSHLADKDRGILDEHLAELQSLGIPADRSLIEMSRASRPSSLRAASGLQMRSALAGEPVWMVRAVLALDDWPWREEFLAAYPAMQRERLAAASPASLPAQAEQELRRQLEQKLAQLQPLPENHVNGASNGKGFGSLKQTARRLFDGAASLRRKEMP